MKTQCVFENKIKCYAVIKIIELSQVLKGNKLSLLKFKFKISKILNFNKENNFAAPIGTRRITMIKFGHACMRVSQKPYNLWESFSTITTPSWQVKQMGEKILTLLSRFLHLPILLLVHTFF